MISHTHTHTRSSDSITSKLQRCEGSRDVSDDIRSDERIFNLARNDDRDGGEAEMRGGAERERWRRNDTYGRRRRGQDESRRGGKDEAEVTQGSG